MTATQLQIPRLDYLPRLHQFLERRRDFFRLTSEQWLNTPPSQPVTVIAPRDVQLVIEGERCGGVTRACTSPIWTLLPTLRQPIGNVFRAGESMAVSSLARRR